MMRLRKVPMVLLTRIQFSTQYAQLKKDDDTGPIVLIKAYKEAKYGNFVDILDEMNICGIARYTFVDIAWYEEKMVENCCWYYAHCNLTFSFCQLTVNLSKNGKRKNKSSCI